MVEGEKKTPTSHSPMYTHTHTHTHTHTYNMQMHVQICFPPHNVSHEREREREGEREREREDKLPSKELTWNSEQCSLTVKVKINTFSHKHYHQSTLKKILVIHQTDGK